MYIQKIAEFSNYTFSSLTPCPEDFLMITKVTDELINIYTKYFGISPRTFSLINDWYDPDKYPMVIREENIIGVNCPTFYIYQFIYQFTHELCHWMIPSKVPDNLRWFEETMAVLSTWFFADKITSVDNCELQDYLRECAKNTIEVNTSELFVPFSDTIKILERGIEGKIGDCRFTDYSRYRSIAFKILPTVENNPSFWNAVPLLCDITPNLELQSSLDEWKNLAQSPAVHDALSKVISSF